MNENDIRVFKILKKVKLVSLTNLILTIKDTGFSGLTRKIKKKLNQKKELEKINIKKKEVILRRKHDSKITVGNILKYNIKKTVLEVIIDYNLNIELVKEHISQLRENNDIAINYMILVKKYGDNSKERQISYERLKDLYSDRAFILISNRDIDINDFYYCFKLKCDENLNERINELLNSKEGMKLFANYNVKNCVSVKSGTFFDFEGSNYYSGGAERYLIDLYEIFKKRNINMDIYQNATKPFFRKYNGINVIGMASKKLPLILDDNYMDWQTNHYINLTKGKSQLHIYSAFFECYPNCASPSIGISHGIGWDNESNKNHNAESFWNSKRVIIESAEKCDCLVSVDTNTANWFQTIDYDIGNKKFSVIPNYVDVKEFSPRKDFCELNDKIIVTYPRRLYKPRGLYLALEAAEKILKEYKNVEFHFVGKGFAQEINDIDSYIKKYPKNIKRYSKSPFEMHEVYKNTDISLIPTLYSEGTSLSCLEAMASGNVVISTRVGGLSDLIINGYNGYLIEPNSDALYETLKNVIENYKKQMVIKKRAVEVAKSFNKKIWIKRWEDVIDKFALNKKSENIGLVEFYVEDVMKLNNKEIDLIKENLCDKKLVYIRSKIKPEYDNVSGNLVQLIDYDDEVVNVAEKVYVEKKLNKNVKRIEEKVII